MIELKKDLFFLSIEHGRVEYAEALRKVLDGKDFSGIVVDLPDALADDFSECVSHLPEVWGLNFCVNEEQEFWLPADPCDVLTEAQRQCDQRRIPLHWLGNSQFQYPRSSSWGLDAHLLSQISEESYFKASLPLLEKEIEFELHLNNNWIPFFDEVMSLAKKGKPLLVLSSNLCGVLFYDWLKNNRASLETEKPQDLRIHRLQKGPLHPEHLYFALGELPAYTAHYEKSRHDIFGETPKREDLIKKLFVETRSDFLTKEEALNEVPLAKMQTALRYSGKLCRYEGNLVPSLIDMIEAAKGVIGDRFALRLIEAAKLYPYFDIEKQDEWISVGVDYLRFPGESSKKTIHLFRDPKVAWRTISLKEQPTKNQKDSFKKQWKPHQLCSHVPEDLQIEKFNKKVREVAFSKKDEDDYKSEPFTSSLLDGLDVRNTLRNWHEGKVYVREEPKVKKKADTVVLVFDSEHDEKYPNQMVWFAEHNDESTLSFYGTEPEEGMVGPGIAKATYGGLSLLFPPRPVIDPFIERKATEGFNLAEKLVWGAAQSSMESNLIYCSSKAPTSRLKNLAGLYGKTLHWVSFSVFGQETLEKLRIFHLLNGKEVRGWAGRFIN